MRFDRWLPVARYDEPQACDECGEVAQKQLTAPVIHADIPPYVSTVTGKLIDGRAARREDLKRAGCRPWEGLDQERKEAERLRAYEEQANDAKLEAAIGEVAAAKSIGIA
jgi:hypothetical protein